MKHAKRLFCAALVLIMALSFAVVPAFADGTTPTAYTTLPTNLMFTLNEGVTSDNIDAVPTFKATVSLKSATLTNTTVWSDDAKKNEDGTAVEGIDAGPLPKSGTGVTNNAWDDKVWTFNTGRYANDEGETGTVIYEGLENGQQIGHQYSFDFSGVTFTEPGVYAYELSVKYESLATRSDGVKGLLNFLGDSTNETEHTHTYPVLVTVQNDDTNGFYISNIIVKSEDGKSKIYQSSQLWAALSETLNYVKLTITNEVKGTAANPNDVFNYYIYIPELGNTGGGIDLVKDELIKGTITRKDGSTETLNIPVGEKIYFTLKQGDKYELYVPDTMIFSVYQLDDDLTTTAAEGTAVGNKVTVGSGEDATEAIYSGTVDNKAPEGYSTVHQYAQETTLNSGSTKYVLDACDWVDDHDGGTDSDGDQMKHEGVIYSTNDNAVHFINTKALKVNTGVTMDILPYVLVVAAAAALAVLTIAKKRKTDW
jgi:hypothetical protein